MKIVVKKCARCGGDHVIYFNTLNNHEKYTHFAICPTTEQPILMRIITDDQRED